jgi:chloride channel 3/4/5
MPIMVSILVSKWVSEAIEKQGIYDLVINLNNHPYLDSKRSYLFTSTFADLCTPVSEDTRNMIDVTGGKDIAASVLRDKVDWLKGIGARDGGFPIIKRRVLTGYISASELEYALGNFPIDHIVDKVDQIGDETALCTLSPLHESTGGEVAIDDPDGTRSPPRTDLRPYIDQVTSQLHLAVTDGRDRLR